MPFDRRTRNKAALGFEQPAHMKKKKETNEEQDSQKVSDFLDLVNEVTGTVRPVSLKETLDVTLPPAPNPDDEQTGTEDAIPSAMPVCDRGTLTMVSGTEAGSIYRLGP